MGKTSKLKQRREAGGHGMQWNLQIQGVVVEKSPIERQLAIAVKDVKNKR